MFGSDNRRKRWYDFLGLVPRRVVKWLVILSIFPLTVAVVLGVYAWRASTYDVGQVLAPLENSVVYDSNGALIGTLSEQARVNVIRKDLPDNLVNAFVAREDEDFFDHSGIVYTSMVRSLLRNISSFSYVQGGSTITMQLARNTFELRDRTLDRKILEIAIARRIESKYDKDTILTSYLNRIYFGQRCYGIAQAAYYYFGKAVKDLNLSECATLAGIVRGPSIFNPVDDYDAAVRQRNATLDRMVDSKFITQQQAEAVKNSPLTVNKSINDLQAQSYPVQWVSREMNKYDDNPDVDTSSIYVISTFNLDIQRELELMVEPRIRELEKSQVWKDLPKRTDDKAAGCLQVAALCVESQTGNVLAVVSGRCPLDGIDRWAMKRQPGFLFLPFVNLGAADAGKNIIRNTPVSTGKTVGYDKIMELGKLIGIEETLPRSDKLYEGMFETPLIHMVRGYLMIMQKGRGIELSAVKQVATGRKNLFFAHPGGVQASKEVFSRESSFVVSTLPPFEADPRRKTTSMDVELPEYGGRFHCMIGRQRAVFLWLGFDQPKEEYWKQKGVGKAIDKLGEDIVEQMYSKMLDEMKRERKQEAQNTEAPAPTQTN